MNVAASSATGQATIRLVRTKRLYEQIAEEIVRLIRDEGMQAGARVPSEIALAGQLGVSRPSVREALIALETAGLIEVRTGDGTYIRQIPSANFHMPWARADDPGPGPREQYEAQGILECEAAAMAAVAMSPDDIDRLEDIVDRMARRIERGQYPVEDHMAFHVGLAQGSGNGVIVGYVRDLWTMRQGPMWETMRGQAVLRDSLNAGVKTRRQLIKCLRNRDSRGARAAMRQHFRRMRKIYFAE